MFDVVVAIEPLPPEPVYDIEVEGTHNFVANGIVAHNSTLGPAAPGAPGEDPEGPVPAAPVSPPTPPPRPGMSGASEPERRAGWPEAERSRATSADDQAAHVNRLGEVVGDIDDASRLP